MRSLGTLRIRRIRSDDDAAMAAIIRAVMPSFGAVGPGFAINDPEVDFMSRAYDRPGAAFFVVETADADGSRIVGGGGIAPLDGKSAAEGFCELRKMYFLPEARGRGVGQQLLAHCLQVAQQLGHRVCYLETLSSMTQASKLYERFGFERLPAALGATGHHGCDKFYARSVDRLDDIAPLLQASGAAELRDSR